MLASSPAPRRDSSRAISWSPNQSALTSQPDVDETPSTTGPAHAFARRANFVAPITRWKRRWSRAPLLSFLSPSARSNRDALPGAAKLRTIPLRRCLPARDPRVRDLVGWRRPCGFTPDGCDAVVLDVRTGRLPFAGSIRRLAAAAKRAARKFDSSSIATRGRGSGKPIDRAHRRSVTSSATASLDLGANDACEKVFGLLVHFDPLPKPGHAPTRSLARCTATRRLEPSRPGWMRIVPSLGTSLQRRSWGS
jgi:hypothetical protein